VWDAHESLIRLLDPVWVPLAASLRTWQTRDGMFTYDLDYFDWKIRLATIRTGRDGYVEVVDYIRPKKLSARLAAQATHSDRLWITTRPSASQANGTFS
jgi:hypothetical protein